MEDKPGKDSSKVIGASDVKRNEYHAAVAQQARAVAADIVTSMTMQIPDPHVHLNALILALCQHIVGVSMGQQDLIDKRKELVIQTLNENLPVYRQDFLRFLQEKARKEGKQ